MASVPNFQNYENLLAVDSGRFGQVDPEKLQEADDKRTALENIKQFGEVKTYLSGKPILQKVIDNLSKTKMEDLGKLGVDTNELSANYTAGIRAAGNEAQNMLSSAKQTVSALTSKDIPVRGTAQDLIGDFDPENSAQLLRGNITQPSASIRTMSRVDSGQGEGAITRPITQVSDDINEGLAQTSFGAVNRTTIGSAVNKTEDMVKATSNAGGVADSTSAGVEGTEAVASVLDGIPGAEVFGLIAGLGATLYGALHHVKNPKPVDNIHIAPQSGVE
tara:strand:+ start:71 stop:898 length:828 start_codon:yes stop_codon:yes gene_type:complete